MVLIPPPNFGMVEDGLYRSGQPNELSYPFLERLHLKTIVWLAPEDPTPRLSARDHSCSRLELMHPGALVSTSSTTRRSSSCTSE